VRLLDSWPGSAIGQDQPKDTLSLAAFQPRAA
jgi:hypothetical protein